MARSRSADGDLSARLRATIEATSDVVAVARPDGTVEFLNRAGRRLIGVAEDAPLDTLRSTVIHSPATMERLRGEAFPAAVARGTWSGDGELITMAGERIPVSIVIVAHAPETPEGTLAFSAIMRDLRERTATMRALHESQQFLTGVLESLSESVIVYDAAGEVILYNRAAAEAFGVPVDHVAGRSVRDRFAAVLQPDGVSPMPAAQLPHARVAATGQDVDGVEFVLATPGRAQRTMVANARPLRDRWGHLVGAVTAARDVTARRTAQRALVESEARFRRVLESVRSVAVTLDAGGAVTFANDAMLTLMGWNSADVIGRSWEELLPPPADDELENPGGAEQELATRFGERRLIAWDTTEIRDQEGRAVGRALIGRDITNQRTLEHALAALSERDELTGLANRRGFRRAAMLELRSARRSGRGVALICLDLDDLKKLNDQHGHAAGDDALRSAAAVLRAGTRETDHVARLGGDELVVCAPGIASREEVDALVERILSKLDTVNAEARARGRPFDVSLSMGVALAEGDEDLDAVLQRADQALYEAKARRAAKA